MTTDNPCLRLGIIADPQYADLDPDPRLNRYFRRSLEKLREAVTHFNSQELDAVLVLGDLIDRGWENFAAVLGALDDLKAPRILLPGNHDFLVDPARLPEVYARLRMPEPYYELVIKGFRLLLTDGNEVSTFAPPAGNPRRAEAERRLAEMTAAGAPNANAWNAGMSEKQVAWVRERLAAAEASNDRVILLGHYPIHPLTDHAMWGAEEFADLLAASPPVLAYLCGHDHRGSCAERGGVHFLNFCGMVDTEKENAFAVLSIYGDHIEVAGHGREPDRHLPIARAKAAPRGRS